jgi:heme A synthase
MNFQFLGMSKIISRFISMAYYANQHLDQNMDIDKFCSTMGRDMNQSQKKFSMFAWFTLGYNVLVILWGALVRATGSGAGCGANWPSCQGEVIPVGSSLETWIEYAHRATSGIALILVVILVIWAFRAFTQSHFVRRAATWSLIFIIIEALVGAGLVLFELVAENNSSARAIIIAIHLANTFLLLGAMTLTAWGASKQPVRQQAENVSGWLGLGAVSLLILGMSGAVTALGDTLFPMSEIAEMGEDIQSHFLVQMRAWHPMLAVVLGGLMAWIAYRMGKSHAAVKPWSNALIGLYIIQLVVGLTNITLNAPLWMQMVHLLLADSVWMVYVLMSAALLFKTEATLQRPKNAHDATG